MAKLSDGTFTPIISRTYFVDVNMKDIYCDVPTIPLITNPDNLFDYEKRIYMMGKMYDDWVKEDPSNSSKEAFNKKCSYNMKGKESEKTGSIDYFPADENKEGFSENVGIRIAGVVSRTFIKKVSVFFRKEYSKKKLEYELIAGNESSGRIWKNWM